ncbi:MAG: hypothetical protein ACOYEJ_02355 [Mahellales bacterium]|jgi:hypothetical protein
MPLYENRRNAENRIKIKDEWKEAIVFGSDNTLTKIIDVIKEERAKRGKGVTIAFDGWYGVDWDSIINRLDSLAKESSVAIKTQHIYTAFKELEEIRAYKAPYITDNPSFGVVNTQGTIEDIMDAQRVKELGKKLKEVRQSEDLDAFIVYGCGSAVKELSNDYDIRMYFDKTRQPLLWQMWDGELIPFGMYEPDKNYGWKEYYYNDYYLLHRQKNYAFENMDFYVEAIEPDDLKMLPREVYDGIMKTLVRYPIKEVKIYQPGPWGAYRYRDLWDIPGLECNAWNELAGPELSILVDVGREELLNMPMTNLMQYSQLLVGPYLDEHYPELFPLDVWLDDGYFPKPTPAERTSMPIHNHPSTEYVKRHFKEPLGRYETYYIAEAYEGANTWMGYKEDVDLEEWERKCRESERNMTPIPDWKDYVANWDSNVGDLYLIPPGTTHGHGGNQMVLEMDTCPSIAGTEYSFFLYDYVRNSWDDKTKTMTGKPVKMHLEHGFNMEQWRRENWVKDHLLAKPKVIKWTKEYSMDRYSSYGPMPFEIERFHFKEVAQNDTQGRFMHIVTLTVGDRVEIRSKNNPELKTEIELFQSAIVPACFGEYEFINMTQGQCTVVQLRWKKG